MRTTGKLLSALLAPTAALALAGSAMAAGHGQVGFGFNARDISGFPIGSVSLTGGELTGCLEGQGVRWDTAELITETITFKCTGQAGEEGKHATSDEHHAVLQADFYRAGDGIDESFTAQMIVSPDDIAPDIEGVQNVWVQGVGCGSAIVHFNSTH
jgi:hypothetical protein